VWILSCVAVVDWPRVVGWSFPVVVALALLVPLVPVVRAVVVAATAVDTIVSQALASSAAKEAALLLVLAVAAATPWAQSRLRPRADRSTGVSSPFPDGS
jgi:hypothetical protein